MKTTLIKTADVVAEFAISTQNKDLEFLKHLLHEDGTFETENEKDLLDRPQVNKQNFFELVQT